jgi:hypothetical protein
MTAMILSAYLVANFDKATDKAMTLVLEKDAKTPAIGALFAPLSKIVSYAETDAASVTINCRIGKGIADRIGFPYTIDLDDSFAEKLGLTA